MISRFCLMIYSAIMMYCGYNAYYAIHNNDFDLVMISGIILLFALYLWIYNIVKIIKEDFPVKIDVCLKSETNDNVMKKLEQLNKQVKQKIKDINGNDNG